MKEFYLDEGFPGRVFYTSLVLAVLTVLGSTSLQSFPLTLSLALGSGTSLVLSRVLWWTILRMSSRDKEGAKRFFLCASLLKYLFLIGVLYLVFRYLQVVPIAFLAGIGLVPMVIVLKLAGMVLVSYLKESVSVGPKT
ncbi:MAG: ATP synthase subunit I [Candidatus Brocadiales bacterium]